MANLLGKDGIAYYSHGNIEYTCKLLADRLTDATNVKGLDS